MNLCNDGHDEVCYETRDCPACIKIRELTEEIDALQAEVDELEMEERG